MVNQGLQWSLKVNDSLLMIFNGFSSDDHFLSFLKIPSNSIKKLKSYLENGETMRQEDLDPNFFCLSLLVGDFVGLMLLVLDFSQQLSCSLAGG